MIPLLRQARDRKYFRELRINLAETTQCSQLHKKVIFQVDIRIFLLMLSENLTFCSYFAKNRMSISISYLILWASKDSLQRIFKTNNIAPS